jgi:hypothetical protein
MYTRELSDEEKVKIYGNLFEKLNEARTNFQSYAMKVTYGELKDVNYNTEQANNWDNIRKDLEEEIKEKPKRSISLKWEQRSCDVPLGIPYNIASYALLLLMIAKTVNMVPDELIGNLGDTHIYLNQLDGVNEQLSRDSFDLPTVTIYDRVVSDISEYTIDDITLENYTSQPKIYFPLSN